MILQTSVLDVQTGVLMEKDRSHSHRYNPDDQRSTSQPGVLEESVDDQTFSSDQFSRLIAKTSEINKLTAHTIHKDYKYNAVWIGLTVVAGITLIYFFD
jgi:hypothetical protein